MEQIRKLLVLSVLLSYIPKYLSEDPYVYHTWIVKYTSQSPLGVPQNIITINGLFPGPKINCTSNNNIVVNVFNKLDEPLLFTWNGVQQRKNSWHEGTLGTNCPILPGKNYTYKFQVKDQIGSFYYYPSTPLLRAAGGYGLLAIHSRELIPVPFDRPEDEFALFVGDWYAQNHTDLRTKLEQGRSIGTPDGVLINGQHGQADGKKDHRPMFIIKPGRTYRYRICNVGMKYTVNVRFQSHTMKVVEIEGSHTVQNVYDSLDVHLGQCYSVLVTANQIPHDYYIVASTRFARNGLVSTATMRYLGAKGPASAVLPPEPEGVPWSINQFQSFRWNLTASAARPNPQGSYHYGKINITRTIKLATSAGRKVGALTRYSVNGVSHIDPETPLKLAEYYGVAEKVFKYNIMQDEESGKANEKIIVAPNVINATFRNFVEIVFENKDQSVQSWHLSGHAFFAVGMEAGKWTPEKRSNYNLMDAISRHTIQVFPNSWSAVLTTLDNAGMWNLRSVNLERQYLGEQLYISVLSPARSLRDEYNLPPTQLICGIVKDLPPPPPFNS